MVYLQELLLLRILYLLIGLGKFNLFIIILFLFRKNYQYSYNQANLRASVIVSVAANALIFERFGYGFGIKIYFMTFFVFWFYYLKHYQKNKTFSTQNAQALSDHVYFKDVTEDERIEIEHKNRIRMMGVGLENSYFNDYWFGGYKSCI